MLGLVEEVVHQELVGELRVAGIADRLRPPYLPVGAGEREGGLQVAAACCSKGDTMHTDLSRVKKNLGTLSCFKQVHALETDAPAADILAR